MHLAVGAPAWIGNCGLDSEGDNSPLALMNAAAFTPASAFWQARLPDRCGLAGSSQPAVRLADRRRPVPD
jgi:hypothetical protein